MRFSPSVPQENVSLITEINELRKELDAERSLVKHYRSQVSVLKKTSKPRPDLVSSDRPQVVT